MSPDTTALLVLKVADPDKPAITRESVQQHLSAVVEGTPVEFSDHVLRAMTDLARVKKAYKLNSVAGSGSGSGKGGKAAPADVQEAAADDFKQIEVAMLGAMALRGAS